LGLLVAFDRLATSDDEVDLAVGLLKRAIGVAPFGRWRWSSFLPVVVVVIVVVLATSIIMSVISSVVALVVVAVITTITPVVVTHVVAIIATVVIAYRGSSRGDNHVDPCHRCDDRACGHGNLVDQVDGYGFRSVGLRSGRRCCCSWPSWR
jgi:hypothetical protein